MDTLIIIISLLFFVIEIITVVFLWLKIKRYHKLTLKDTIVYPVVMLLTVITLIIAKYYFLSETGFGVLFSSLKDSVSIVALAINSEVASTLYHHSTVASKFLFAAYIGEYVISAFALFSISISLINVAFWNLSRRIINLLSINNKEVDYILGFNEDTKEYIKTYYEDYTLNKTKKDHRLVILLDSAVLDHFEAEKFYLHKYKVSYRLKPYTDKVDIEKTIASLSKGFRRKNFISFIDDDKQNFLFVSSALNYINNNSDKNVNFIVISNTNQEKFLNNIIYDFDNVDGIKDRSNNKIKIYNKHDLISLEFIKNHNFAKYMPKEYVDDDLTIKDADINLYVIGFGKVNQAVLRDVLITNQFVAKVKEGNKYKLSPKRINVEIYDNKLKIECLDLFSGILKYQKSKYDKDKYLDLDEDYLSYVKFNPNVSIFEQHFINDLFENINNNTKSKKQINYFLISLDSDFVNFNVAKKIKSNIDNITGAHNTYFVRLEEDLFDIENEFVSYGRNNDVLSYNNIVGNHLFDTANKFNYYYNDKKNDRIPTPFEAKNNYYNVCSLYFKLSLIYLKKNKEDKYDINTLIKLMNDYYIIEEAKEYGLAKDKNVEFYDHLCESNDKFSVRDVLSFTEHQRWNAYELSIGALPMTKEYIKETLDKVCNKIKDGTYGELGKKICSYDDKNNRYKLKINKTSDELYHLCITSEYGLKEYYIFLSELVFYAKEKYDIDISLGLDVIQYDYKYVDVIKNDLNSNKEMIDIYNELIYFLKETK